MKDVIKYIRSYNLGKCLENRSFKDYTTLKIGGKIRLVYLPNTIENFITFYNFYSKLKKPLVIIGAGSNILASDKDFDGVVVSFSNLDVKYFRIGGNVTAFAGCSVVRLAYDLVKSGYCGGEFLAGIPGTVGGVIYMNAGANGRETKDIVLSAKLLDKNGVSEYSNKDLKFKYRSSILQEKELVVLEAKFTFQKEKSNGSALETIKNLKTMRKENQPIDKLSAGCAFQNPKECSAWELIDKVGLRGYSINDAQVSTKHSNFLINNGSATSSDMISLIELIKLKVKENFNIDLKCEWRLINFDP